MHHTKGKVPHFSMRPHPVVSTVLVFVLIIGLLVAMSFFHKEEGTGHYRHYGILALIITGLLSLFLAILATAKMWFPHLWKKNSTHKRHRQHTRNHPAVKEREFRKSINNKS
jgi:hypothetical protein